MRVSKELQSCQKQVDSGTMKTNYYIKVSHICEDTIIIEDMNDMNALEQIVV